MFDFLIRPFRRNFGKDKMFYRAVDDMFGFIPHNIELYKLALIHKSASIVLEDGQHINNERLEFLGDAVIESVTSDYLFIEFPDKNEGFLTQLRSKMVSRQSLNGVAKLLGLDDHVITNSSNISSQKHIYGDAFEAMMGAIYLDQGYNFVNRLLINTIFANHLKVATLLEAETDFKSRLIEWCQKNHHSISFSTQHDATYSSGRPFFYSKVLIDGMEVGYGAGESKKEAEQRACYSVSQGFNDNDCAKLLDTLDDLDAQQGGVQGDVESKSEDKKPRKATQRRSSRKKDVQPQAEPLPAGQPEQINESQPQEEQPAESALQPKPVKRVRKPRPKREKDGKSA
jgi:ribonuclease-3